MIMFSLKKLLSWSSVLIPAIGGAILYFFAAGCRFLAFVLFGCAGLAGAFLLLHRLRRSHPKTGNILLGILSFLTGTCLVIGIWVGILIGQAMQGEPERSCQYLIVLGAGVNGTTPSQSLQERIDAAGDYLKAHPEVQCILSGGQGDQEDISEAECMFRALTAKGIAPERFWLEDKSTSTKENIAFSLALLQEKVGEIPEEIGILSSQYHLYRAGYFVREQGLQPVCIGAKTARIELFISYFVREIFAVCFYSVFG